MNAYTYYRDYVNLKQATFIPPPPSRPTEMPDIITIPPGFGGAAYTFKLEQMVHYKLEMPQPFPHEQIRSDTWRLVRHLPKECNIWHPTNDNLEGVYATYGGQSFYGTTDKTDSRWSVPFNKLRPAHTGVVAYSMPDEMFICDADMDRWVYFPRTSHVMNMQAS